MSPRKSFIPLLTLFLHISKSRFTHRLIYTIVALLFSAIVLVIFVQSPGINGYDRAMFGDMIYGKANKPFVCRTLLPSTVRLITFAIPKDIKTFLNHSIGEKRLVEKTFKDLRWEQEYLVEYGIALILMYLSICGFLYAIRYFFRGVFHSPGKFVDMISLVALLGLPPFFKYYSYLYDFPTLFLFTLGLGLMVRQKWLLFLSVFLIASFNKETTILLTMIFFIHFYNKKRMDKQLFERLILIQLIIFASVRVILSFVFINNAGGFFEFHLIDHNILLLKSYSLSTAFTWLVISLLVFYKWSDKPSFLRRGIWILVPPLAFGLFFGFFDELRDYYEVYPIVILLLSHSIGHILGIKMTNIEEFTPIPFKTSKRTS